jgi:hypothetical protein
MPYLVCNSMASLLRLKPAGNQAHSLVQSVCSHLLKHGTTLPLEQAIENYRLLVADKSCRIQPPRTSEALISIHRHIGGRMAICRHFNLCDSCWCAAALGILSSFGCRYAEPRLD